jgi:Zn2+/Cd2+-exporting ATPase
MVGSQVFAGTLNSNGRLVVRVGKPAADTTLAHIIHLVGQAREEKAPVERLFDRVGTAYTIAVISGSIIAFTIMATVPMLGLSWKDAGYRAITLLIVASPCALIISTPVVILSAIASCARRGIVLKGGRHLESLAAVRALVFDKTGTLTTGQVQLAGMEYVGGLEEANTDHTLLRVAASLEANSTHPLAGAVMAAAQAASVTAWPVQNFQQEAGHGLRGTVNGQTVVMGSPGLLDGVCHTTVVQQLSQRVAQAEAQGETAVVLFHAGRAGLLRFRDTVRTDSAATVQRLHELGVRPQVMLTGDNKAVAQAVAGELGLDGVHAELLPEDKLRIVTQMVREHRVVAMVGDGVNDAPALARATVGIAMGSIGSDAALEAADVVLLSNCIDRLPWLIETARHARRVMRQNLTFAIAVIAVLVVCSLIGKVGLPLGVVGHEGSTLLVVGNGLRLLLRSK